MEIQTKNLTKKYGSKTVVDHVELHIKPGQILGLLGPNGAGKSTTIGMLSGQIKPTSGSILINKEEFAAVPPSLRGNIGVMPQDVIIWDYLTVEENLYYTGRMQNMSKKQLTARVNYLIDALNLQRELKTLGRNLSGGYKRRLNLAISIIHEPTLIFLDEPTPGIDPQNRRFLWDFIGTLRGNTDYSVVLTDHYLEEAEKLSDYVVIIDKGAVIAQGTVAELKKEYGEGKLVQLDIDPSNIETNKIVEKITHHMEEIVDEIAVVNNRMTFIALDYAKVLKRLVDFLDNSSIEYEDIAIKEPSLEDVFLLLTGKTIRD